MADSSSSSESSSDIEGTPAPPAPLPPPKPAKRKAKSTNEPYQKRLRKSEAIRQLTDKVSEITNFLGNFCQPICHSSEYGDDVDADVSREMYSDDDQEPSVLTESPNALKLPF